MNHLQHETSPYLLQHAANPVEWYAWKPEAFLDGCASGINALLDAYLLKFELAFIDQAVTLTEFVLTHILDESDNLFYFTAASQTDLRLRPKEFYDNVNCRLIHWKKQNYCYQ